MPKPSPEFEKNFADLAYTYVNNNAPKLLDFMVGFQVLDKNDEDTNAIGIFGFATGGKKKEMFYAPVFFLNGKLKGQELLYNGTADMFIPLEEAWVDFILNKKTAKIGEISDRTQGELSRYLPDFRNILGRGNAKGTGVGIGGLGGRMKFAAELSPEKDSWFVGSTVLGKPFDVTPALGMFMPEDGQHKAASEKLNLAKAVSKSPELAHALASRMATYPEFTKMAAQFHTVDEFIMDAEEEAGTTDFQMDEVKKPVMKIQREKVQVLGEDGIRDLNLTDEEKAHYVKSAYIIRDERDNDTIDSLIEGESLELSSPSTSGTYEVLMADLSFKSCLVIKEHQACYSTRCSGKTDIQFIVILPSGEAVTERNVTTTTTYPLEAMSTHKGLTEISAGDYTPDEDSFNKLTYIVGEDGIAYSVSRSTNIIISNKVPRIIQNNGDLIVPGNTKVLKTSRIPWKEEAQKGIYTGNGISIYDILPENIVDAKSLGGEKVKFASLAKDTVTESRRDAVTFLLKDLNLSKEAAEKVYSDTIENGNFTFIAKQAAGGPSYIDDYDADAPDVSVPDDIVGSEQWSGAPISTNVSRTQEANLPVNSHGDYGELEPDVYQTAERATKTKQKDVFDVTVLSSLIKSTDTDNLINEYLPSMFQSVDKLGRTLFLMYSHADEFKERYGQQDMTDLENTLKNAFTTNGKLVLFLHKRSISSDVDGEGVSLLTDM